MLIVVIGKSGAGKTTLANHLRDEYGFKIADGLPSKAVPEDERVVVDWNGKVPARASAPGPWKMPDVSSGATTLENLPIMAGPVGAGRDLVGAVELLGGIVVEVTRKRLAGIGVSLPNGAGEVDTGRMLRTADRLMDLLDVTKTCGEVPKESGATILLGKAEIDAARSAIRSIAPRKRNLASRRALAELGRAFETLNPMNEKR